MKIFNVNAIPKWNKIAQLRIKDSVYDTMTLDELNNCIADFLKRNGAKHIIKLDKKQIYCDYQVGNTHIRISFEKVKEVITITYTHIEIDYRVVYIENK